MLANVTVRHVDNTEMMTIKRRKLSDHMTLLINHSCVALYKCKTHRSHISLHNATTTITQCNYNRFVSTHTFLHEPAGHSSCYTHYVCNSFKVHGMQSGGTCNIRRSRVSFHQERQNGGYIGVPRM